MTFTLLLDLDDTLLENNSQTFITAYFKALSFALKPYVNPDDMLPALLTGSKAMFSNQNPSQTLLDVFNAHFYPLLGLEPASLEAAIEEFYDTHFLGIAQLTKVRPVAARLVQWAKAQGFRVVVATNPLFPAKAIRHRMRWAGVAPEEFHFDLISSMETFHFTKMDPAYYAELLMQLGWTSGPVIMVGDDLDMDIRSAGRLGLPTYWVTTGTDSLPADVSVRGQGSLDDFFNWIQQVDLQTLIPTFDNRNAIMPILQAVPAALQTMSAHLTPNEWRCQPEPDEWCLAEITCHLRDVEREVNLPRIEAVLANHNPFIAGQVTDDWVRERNYANQDGQTALLEFSQARKNTLERLKSIEEQQWNRPARHAVFGPTTLHELTKFISQHDLAHVRQSSDAIRAAIRR